jgi:hypothetical protein
MIANWVLARIFVTIRRMNCACAACEAYEAPLFFCENASWDPLKPCTCREVDMSLFLSVLVTVRLFHRVGVPLRQYVFDNDGKGLEAVERHMRSRLGCEDADIVFDARVIPVLAAPDPLDTDDVNRIIDTLPREPIDVVGSIPGLLDEMHAFAQAYALGIAAIPGPPSHRTSSAVVFKAAVETPFEHLTAEQLQSMAASATVSHVQATPEDVLHDQQMRRDAEGIAGASLGPMVKFMMDPDGTFHADVEDNGMDPEYARELLAVAMQHAVKQQFGCDATVMLEDATGAGRFAPMVLSSSAAQRTPPRTPPTHQTRASRRTTVAPGPRGGGGGGGGGEAAAAGASAAARAGGDDADFDMGPLLAVMAEIEAEEAAKGAKKSAKQAAKQSAKAAQAAKQEARKARRAASATAAAAAADNAALAAAQTAALTSPDVRAALDASCIVCIDNHAAMAFACGHVNVCEHCYDSGALKGCPTCHQGVLEEGEVGRRADLVWPDAKAVPPTCTACSVAFFPQVFCIECKSKTCTPCGKRCKCKAAAVRKLFWS